MHRLVVFILMATVASGASAQVERLLIPFNTPEPVQGAHGALWVAELAILNRNDHPTVISSYVTLTCPLPTCFSLTPPGITFYPSLGHGTLLRGRFLRLSPADADKVVVQLRARDLSRQADDWGAEVPTVRETKAPIGMFNLLDVPMDANYRVMLRFYHFANDALIQARVRYFATPTSVYDPLRHEVESDRLLTEEMVTFIPGTEGDPGYAELTALADRHPSLLQAERIRVEVEALSPDVRIWGFATITNNETQHVTIISAQ